jgi:hypothetical protein
MYGLPQAKAQQLGLTTASQGSHAHGGTGLKLDKQSDTIETLITGTCRDCMILQAVADITNKDGIRLGLKNDVYIHHILVANLGHKWSLAPLVPVKSSCPPGQRFGGGTQGMGTPKGGGTHSRLKRQLGGKGAKGFSNFDLFIIKGNEGNSQTFSPYNTTNVKSGYWIGRNDRLSAMVRSFFGLYSGHKADGMISQAEVVNYKNTPQEVYLTVDLEYLKFDAGRPKEYLDISFGAIMAEQCGDLYLRKLNIN